MAHTHTRVYGTYCFFVKLHSTGTFPLSTFFRYLGGRGLTKNDQSNMPIVHLLPLSYLLLSTTITTHVYDFMYTYTETIFH